MNEKKEFLTEERLKKGIWITSIGIVIVIAALFGYWYYLNRPATGPSQILQKSITEKEQQLKKQPNSKAVHLELAQLYLQAKRFDDAIDECKAVLKINPEDSMAYTFMGIAYEAKGKTNTAVDYYNKAIQKAEGSEMKGMNPAFTESVFRLGRIYMDQKKYDKAIELFTKSVSYNSIDSDARYNLGLAYLKKGMYDEAIAQLTIAVRYVPDYVEAQYALGQAFEKKGNKENAIKSYKMALKYKSDYKPAKDALKRLEK